MNAKHIMYFFEILAVLRKKDFSSMSVCILGNQLVRKHAYEMDEFRFLSFRKLLVAKGFGRVVSIDANGEDESVRLNFSEPLPESLLGSFDVVVNSGTTEHIKDGQWQVFRNVHDLLRREGTMLHYLPVEGRGHGFWFYDESFFERLAKSCNYGIYDMRITDNAYKYHRNKHSLFATLLKDGKSVFMGAAEWVDPTRDELGFTRFGDGYGKFLEANVGKENV